MLAPPAVPRARAAPTRHVLVPRRAFLHGLNLAIGVEKMTLVPGES
jgi:hypothetical protein